MSIRILILSLLLSPILPKALDISEQKKFTFYYFGASDCGYCNIVENIVLMKKIKRQLTKELDGQIKFVIVCFDNDISSGLDFVQKYGKWDEISIGQRYFNEIALQTLNNTKIPGLPHVVVSEDSYKLVGTIPILLERTIVVDLAGFKQIRGWADKNYYPIL